MACAGMVHLTPTGKQGTCRRSGDERGVQRRAVIRVQQRGVAHVVRLVQARVQARKVLRAQHMHHRLVSICLAWREIRPMWQTCTLTKPLWLACPIMHVSPIVF